MEIKFEIKMNFAGCLIPAAEIAKTLGVTVKSQYKTRSAAQIAADKLGTALIKFGMTKVELHIVPVTK